MGTRTALRQVRWVTFGVILAFVWTLLVVIEVATAFDWTAWAGADYLGQAAASGIVGLVVMAVFLGLLLVLYGELTETEPGPAAWPPTE